MRQIGNVQLHQFSPQGVSAIVMLAESHISVHTWPEKEYAAADVFTCGEAMYPQKAVEVMKERFQSKKLKQRVIKRMDFNYVLLFFCFFEES